VSTKERWLALVIGASSWSVVRMLGKLPEMYPRIGAKIPE
jgi:hypothetical protein